jgi:hypothetical protein
LVSLKFFFFGEHKAFVYLSFADKQHLLASHFEPLRMSAICPLKEDIIW